MKQLLIGLMILLVSMTLFGEKLATLPDIFKPLSLVLDDQQVYITDGASVSIFSRKDYSLIKKFGKQGSGPQEFMIPRGMGGGLIVYPQRDYLVINSMGKVSFFKKNGEYIKEIKSPSGVMGGAYQPIGSGFAGVGFQPGENQSMSFAISLFDEKLVKQKQLYTQPFFSKGRMELPMVVPIFYVSDNKILTSGGQKEFKINILDATGKQLAAIAREYKLLKVTKDYEKGVHDFFKTNPQTKQAYDILKNMITFADEFPAIQMFFVDNQKIYIQTYLKKGDTYEFFVYDFNGKLLKQLYLPMAFLSVIQPCPTAVKDNKLYQVIENIDEEEWELHAVNIL